MAGHQPSAMTRSQSRRRAGVGRGRGAAAPGAAWRLAAGRGSRAWARAVAAWAGTDGLAGGGWGRGRGRRCSFRQPAAGAVSTLDLKPGGLEQGRSSLGGRRGGAAVASAVGDGSVGRVGKNQGEAGRAEGI